MRPPRTRARPPTPAPLAMLLAALLALAASLAGCSLPAVRIPDGPTGPFATLSNNLTALAVDPAQSNRLYLGARYGLFVSGDSGAHWPAATRGAFATAGVRSLAPSMLPDGPLWLVAGDGSVWLSPDGGESWRPAAVYAPPQAQPTASTQPSATAAAQAKPTATPKTRPQPTATPIPAPGPLPARAVAWVQPGTASTGQAFAAVPSFGLYTTTDAGVTWSFLPLPGVDGTPRSLLTDPADGRRLLLATSQGLYRSTDGGANWSPSSFIQGNILALAASPTKPDIVYCATDRALYRSTNGGASFAGVTGGYQFALLAVGATPDALYAVDGLRVLDSTDGGRTWTSATPTPAPIVALAVAPAPKGDAHADAIFAGLGAPPGLLTSLDGGANWGQTGG